jgi:protein ImuB
MTLTVNAARPTRDPAHIARLFVHRAERLSGEYDAGFGIDLIRLGASSTSPISAQQMGAFDAEDGTTSVLELYDRMTSRLGPLGVVHSRLVDTHVPERAVKLEPAVVAADAPAEFPPPRAPRPLRLLPQPEPITVTFAQVPDGPPPSMIWRRVAYRFVRSSGPERIGDEWWLSQKKLMLTEETVQEVMANGRLEQYYKEGRAARDYFVAEDETGRRFWIFREGLYEAAASPRWFLHGFFA